MGYTLWDGLSILNTDNTVQFDELSLREDCRGYLLDFDKSTPKSTLAPFIGFDWGLETGSISRRVEPPPGFEPGASALPGRRSAG